MVQHGNVFTPNPSFGNPPKRYSVLKVLHEVYHLDMQPVKGYSYGMDKKKQTTMRFSPQDMQAIARIRDLYGCISDTAAVRLALQIVARQEQFPLPSRPQEDSPLIPPPERGGSSRLDR